MRGVEDEADAAAAAALEQENAAELAEFTAEVCVLPPKCWSPHALRCSLSSWSVMHCGAACPAGPHMHCGAACPAGLCSCYSLTSWGY